MGGDRLVRSCQTFGVIPALVAGTQSTSMLVVQVVGALEGAKAFSPFSAEGTNGSRAQGPG